MLLVNQLRSKEQNIEKQATVEQEKDNNSDHREELLKNLSDLVFTSNQKDKGDRAQKRKQEVEEPKKKAKKPKRASLMDTIRQNHLSYQMCITKKMSKILRTIGISSSSESDED